MHTLPHVCCSLPGINILWNLVIHVCKKRLYYCSLLYACGVICTILMKLIVEYNPILMCEMSCIQSLELSRKLFIILYLSGHVVMLVSLSCKCYFVLVYAKL